MTMYWWQWVLIFFFGCFVLFLIFANEAMLRLLKAFRIIPRYDAVYFDDFGKVTGREQLKGTGLFQSEWKLQGSNPNKVKYMVKPQIIGKAKPAEFDKDNYLEIPYADSDKKLIIFNIKGYNKNFYKIIKSISDDRDFHFNLSVQKGFRIDELLSDRRKEFEQFKKDHKEVNRSGPIFTKAAKVSS